MTATEGMPADYQLALENAVREMAEVLEETRQWLELKGHIAESRDEVRNVLIRHADIIGVLKP